jgi:hypothetical protein
MALPTVTSVAPNQGPSGGGTTVTINGTNFLNAGSVAFGDPAAQFVINSGTQITAFSPPSNPGTVDVRITNTDGTSATGAGDLFFYTSTPPTVTGVAPAQGPTAGGTTVTITGTNFLNVTGVFFGDASATFNVNSPTQITTFLPPGNEGTVDVRVSNGDGTSTLSPADRFLFVGAPPTVTGVTPNAGPTSGGTTVTISGNNFLGASSVTFTSPSPVPTPVPGPPGGGTSTAPVFVINSATQITAFLPAHAAGTVHLRVTSSDGTSAPTAGDQFTYQ